MVEKPGLRRAIEYIGVAGSVSAESRDAALRLIRDLLAERVGVEHTTNGQVFLFDKDGSRVLLSADQVAALIKALELTAQDSRHHEIILRLLAIAAEQNAALGREPNVPETQTPDDAPVAGRERAAVDLIITHGFQQVATVLESSPSFSASQFAGGFRPGFIGP
ncbi:MAG: hypothetical protein ACRC7G_16735, partial [Beijerinckiaceae bacterium]